MQYTETSLKRTFILRLQDGDILPFTIEEFAKQKSIISALVFFIGGAKQDSTVVVGPKDSNAKKPIPIKTNLFGISESLAIGTIFTNEENKPKLHMHGAFGREHKTITGCTREGVKIWEIGEVVILELDSTEAKRKINSNNGFELLEID